MTVMLASCGTFSEIKRDVDDAAVRRYAATGDLEAEVRELVRPFMERDRPPGLVVGVLLPGGGREIFGYGVTCREGGRRPGGDTLFAIGSTSKGFLSALAAVLVEEGEISWDDTLGDILGEDVRLSSDASEITLLELATHSSGLPRQPQNLRFLAYFMQFLFTGRNFYRHLDRDYILSYLEGFRRPVLTDPTYSNIGYAVLGYVLEHRTGTDLDSLMREKLLGPLGLDATGFEPHVSNGCEARAHPHAGDHPKFMRRGRPVPEWRFTDVLLGAAGLYSTAGEMLTYAAAYLHPGDDETLNRALQDSLKVRHERSGIARALAWAVDDVGGHEIVYQIGFVSGYSCYVGMDVRGGAAVVVLQNSLNWTEAIGHRLLLTMARAAAEAEKR